jgi:hypothetical protein
MSAKSFQSSLITKEVHVCNFNHWRNARTLSWFLATTWPTLCQEFSEKRSDDLKTAGLTDAKFDAKLSQPMIK